MIDGITQARANVNGETAAMQGLDNDTFLQLLVAQLRYQDPMNPTDSQEYLAQAAQFATVERLQQMVGAQNEAIAYQQVAVSSSLVGKHVTGQTEFGDGTIGGVVQSVRFDQGVPTLKLDTGLEMRLGDVERIESAPDTPT